MSKIKEIITHSSKTEKFVMILAAILAVSAILSFLVKEIIDAQEKPTYKVAVVVSSDKERATSMREGVQSYIDKINSDKTAPYHYEMEILQENDPQLSSKFQGLVGKQNYVGIVGFYGANGAVATLGNSDLSIYSLSPFTNQNHPKNFYYIEDNRVKKASFIANYMRNVKKEHFTYFAHDNSAQCLEELNAFDSLYKKFEIPLEGVVNTSQDIKSYFEKVNLGAVYICGDEKSSLEILSKIKESKTELNTYGSSMFALNSFKKQNNTPSDILNGIFTTSPLMFDTSNEEAQSFLNSYRLQHNYDPDWLSAIFYDMAKMAFESKLLENTNISGTIGEYDLTKQSIELPIKMGQFNGEQLISTPIQLQNIKNKHSIGNYIQALRDSRVLYVNDKFMYKTNVVYTGVKINSISQIKQDEESAEVDFSIWFRYQGDFDPSQIEFLNGDVKLKKPEEKIDMENDHYVRFRATGVFSMNFEKDKKSYGTNTINIVYRHKQFNQNNLLFVTDLLGMPTNKEMVEQMEERGVIDTTLGWNVTDFFVSQSLIKDLSEGKPQYIGYQGEDTLFSTMNVELKIESSMLKAKDFIDKKYFIYLLIFAFVGLIGARLMDAKRLGRYWYVHAFILRTLFLPIFVVSLGNIILDWAYVNADHITTSYLVMVYESLWWLVPAYLIDSAVRRFIWIPLEEKAGKKIPAIVIILASFTIYSLAVSGIIAFVLGEELTSMLAASGVLAMVLGFAVQANIANIFSGLVLNMDKLFKVGEIIEFEDICGEVVDISWRTTKIKNWDGVIFTLPNDTISNAQIKNISRTEYFLFEKTVQLHHEIDPKIAVELLNEALMECDLIVAKDHEYYGAEAIYVGHHVIEGEQWVGRYLVWFSTKDYYDMELAENQFWTNVYNIFKREDLTIY